MITFKMFLGKVEPNQIVDIALRARKEIGIEGCAKFGDCKEVCEKLVTLLEETKIPARLAGGMFTTNIDDDEKWDHSWVIVNNNILDPTIDQFFSPLDIDMDVKTEGVYFSHPSWDGPKYVERYSK